MEHGVNEHRVAIGNEKVWTTLDPSKQPAALIGMDLVRLGLERARSADEALDVMTTLLEEHGQGGVCDQTTGESYFSSFLIADPRARLGAGDERPHLGRRAGGGLGRDLEPPHARAASGRARPPTLPPAPTGTTWRHPNAPTGHADVRLAASHACLSAARHRRSRPRSSPRTCATTARAWGAPGHASGRRGRPAEGLLAGRHRRHGLHAPARLPEHDVVDDRVAAGGPGEPLRAWVAPGSPCVSVFVPVFPLDGVPPELGDPRTWRTFAALRDRVEDDA